MKAMLEAYGGDRIRSASDERVILDARLPKSWSGRTPATTTHREHPGTAVQWGEVLYEVMSAEALPSGAVRYTLVPWDPAHALRRCEHYDEASEAARRSERDDIVQRERKRRRALLLAPLTGLLPAAVQERFAREYNLAPLLPTIVSALPFFVVGFVALIFFVAKAFGAPVRVATPWLIVAIALLFESLFRVAVAVPTGRPVGSVIGHLAWAIRLTVTGQREPRAAGFSTATTAVADPQTAHFDRYRVMQPFLAFLPAGDQRRLQRIYGFDAVAWGKRSALLLIALLGVAIAPQLHAVFRGTADAGIVFSLMVNLLIFAEQLARLARLLRGSPAGSIFGMFVKPFTKGL